MISAIITTVISVICLLALYLGIKLYNYTNKKKLFENENPTFKGKYFSFLEWLQSTDEDGYIDEITFKNKFGDTAIYSDKSKVQKMIEKKKI